MSQSLTGREGQEAAEAGGRLLPPAVHRVLTGGEPDADGATAAAAAWLVGDVVVLLPDMDQDALGYRWRDWVWRV